MGDPPQDSKEPKRKRRPRYKGKYPRRYEEKYKELNYEQHTETVEKIIKKGITPAGTHRSICVKEILDVLDPKPGQVGLDATLGFGGHAKELLKRIRPGGRLYGIDVDPIELVRTEARLRNSGFTEKEFITRQINFAGIPKMLDSSVDGFDFILADLGVSSMQLDNPLRGFTFKREGPLDLRLNPERGQSASDLIKTISEKALEKLLWINSDEPNAKIIANAIHESRNNIQTTTDLTDTIRKALPSSSEREVTTTIRRTFQALRIAVNDEFSALDQFLRNLQICLKPNGKVAILSFHSGEDNRVSQSFKEGLEAGIYADISREPIRPDYQEQYDNPRSKSAILRWAIRTGI